MEAHTARVLIERLNRDAGRIARHFGLRYKTIAAERADVTSRYGICYDDGVIKIRLRHAVTGRPLKYSSLVNTLCHELAHLRHFHHGERFKAFYLTLLEYAREQRIYRPGRVRGAPAPALPARCASREAGEAEGPVQLGLFERGSFAILRRERAARARDSRASEEPRES